MGNHLKGNNTILIPDETVEVKGTAISLREYITEENVVRVLKDGVYHHLFRKLRSGQALKELEDYNEFKEWQAKQKA